MRTVISPTPVTSECAKMSGNPNKDSGDLRRFSADREGLVMLGRVLRTENLISEEQKRLNEESDRIMREYFEECARIDREASIVEDDDE
ncbi:hypothetical protein [Acidisoma sp. S159]|uniref:hypothetical protein n=1 Tax=Acidisoma sp. S159 TaxID=1747225 RepID=UPI00131D1535|nr:hypothetical protein [Acidisoma sp. S159]